MKKELHLNTTNNLTLAGKELRMAVAVEPGGWTSGSTSAGKEAPVGIRVLGHIGLFVDLHLEAARWVSAKVRTGRYLFSLAWLLDLPFLAKLLG